MLPVLSPKFILSVACVASLALAAGPVLSGKERINEGDIYLYGDTRTAQLYGSRTSYVSSDTLTDISWVPDQEASYSDPTGRDRGHLPLAGNGTRLERANYNSIHGKGRTYQEAVLEDNKFEGAEEAWNILTASRDLTADAITAVRGTLGIVSAE